MNICFLCGDLSRGGGTEKITQIIANELAEEKETNIFIVDVSNCSGFVYYSLKEQICVVHLVGENIVQKIKKLYLFLKEKNIDIIVNVDIMLMMYSYIPARLNHVAIVSWEQFNYYNDIGSKHTKSMRQFCLKHSDYYINLTEADMKTFKKNFRITIPITYIYNPVVSKDYSKKIYNVESKILITAGNFYKAKGYDYCIQVGELIFEKYPDWKWMLCGDGIEFENINKLVSKSKWKDNFVFTGRISDLEEWMDNSAIYVSCSLSEGFGLVLIEAQQSRLPIVAFDVPFGPSEIISNNVNGFLISNLDVEEMARKIIFLIEHKEERVRFSRNSAILHDRFSLNKIISQWKNIFNTVISKK